MTISRWEPFRDLMTLREAVNRLYEDSLMRPSVPTMAGIAFPMDIYETPDSVVVSAALPGIKPEDLEITVHGETLTIKGEFKPEVHADKEKVSYLLAERRYGTFSRSISLPVSVVPDQASAAAKDGILTLTLPKSETVKPKSIKIKSK